MTPANRRSFEVSVPASTANLGPGFDCLGLALDLHLAARATVLDSTATGSSARTRGVSGSSDLPSSPQENLILRAMAHAAKREGLTLPPVRLAVKNNIPIAGGLGSSAAAIVAGIALGYAVGGKKLTDDLALRCAAELENHVDNTGAALLGELVVSLVRADGSVVALRKKWPAEIRIVAVTPEVSLQTNASRAALPKAVPHADAVFNVQRSALFVAALDAGRYDLLADAMQDRLHQPYRQSLIPGLADILTAPLRPGMLAIALSGSGPTVIALATKNFNEIGAEISSRFKQKGSNSTVRTLDVASHGMRLTERFKAEE
ncbi:MAG TPA: homoserine kinase [Candidatus Acidoferrales bacterium]